jgi:hypothetical protein
MLREVDFNTLAAGFHPKPSAACTLRKIVFCDDGDRPSPLSARLDLSCGIGRTPRIVL